MGWRLDPKVLKAVFPAGEEPPHRNYRDDVRYETTLGVARQQGIPVSTSQCGNDGKAASNRRHSAGLGPG